MAGLWTLNPDAMPFQYSVGDAIIFKNIVLERSGIPFQYSVGDALSRRVHGAQRGRPQLSILRWRCAKAVARGGASWLLLFQYSVGDAARGTVQRPRRGDVQTFNTPLEMPLASTGLIKAARCTSFNTPLEMPRR